MDLSHQEDDSKKSCSMCGTEKTPLWRSGPSGPKSLCNACGIKHRKRSIVICKTNKNKPSKTTAGQALPSTSTETWSKSKPKLDKPSSTNLKQSVKAGLTAFGKDMVRLQKQRSFKRRQRSEEVEAAVLLMSLSCGSVFA